MTRLRPVTIAIAALVTALVAVLTLIVRVPVPATQGYFHFGDVAVFFAGFAFGPAVGLIAGGIGTGLADVLGGYAHYALISLLAHGLQGLLAGWLGHRAQTRGLVLGWLAGGLAMIGVYFTVEMALFGWGSAVAEVPWNLLQAVGGGLIGIPLLALVRRAYPPILQMGQPPAWRDR